MRDCLESTLLTRCYREKFGASLTPGFPAYFLAPRGGDGGAALGYRRADSGLLFLEAYLDRPIQSHVGDLLGRAIGREQIVEIGNFASDNAIAMIELWSAAANDLGGMGEVAVATLTAPLRRMFARIGIPIMTIAPARAARLGTDAAQWGSYYAADPQVCAGLIGEGQDAISAFMARRQRSAVA